LALAVDGSGLRCLHDPYAGGLWAVCEAARNTACVGGLPAGITDGLNFGSPKRPEIFWQLERCVRGLADAAEAFGIPVVSGNVSLFNESGGGAIPPTPMIGMLGILPDASRRIGMNGLRPGHRLGLLRAHSDPSRQGGLGASAAARELLGRDAGAPDLPRPEREAALCRLLSGMVQDSLILAAHDISEGGLAVAAAEMAAASGCGLKLSLPDCAEGALSGAFGEHSGWVIAAFTMDAEPEIARRAEKAGILWDVLGAGIEESLVTCEGVGVWDLLDLRTAHESALPDAIQS
jgi:phosphoribosylformylglycinamidine synthase